MPYHPKPRGRLSCVAPIVMHTLLFELKVLRPWGSLIIAGLMGIIRISKVVSPKDPATWAGWIFFLEFVYPVLLPLLVFTFLEHEKNWRTWETLITVPYRKAWVLLERYLIVVLAAFAGVMAGVRPQEYPALLAPGLALGSLALLGGLAFGEEAGLGISLSWWGISFVVAIAKPELLHSGIANWGLLILSASPLSTAEIMLRKWCHLGIGLVFLLFALVLAEHKRSWT